MSKVRVLVGTRKGAFILTSDERREEWDVSGPHFAGWEIYHLKGSPVNPDRIYASQSSGWFGQIIQRSDDGGQTWEPVGNEFQYEGDPGTHQVVRRHPASVGIHARLAPGAVADRPGHRLCRRGRRGAVPFERWRTELARISGVARGQGASLAARRRWDVLAHDLARSHQPGPHLRRYFGCRNLPHRRRRRELATGEPWAEYRERTTRPGLRRRPLRPQHCDAPVAS